jgi:hypothetical protein
LCDGGSKVYLHKKKEGPDMARSYFSLSDYYGYLSFDKFQKSIATIP